MKLLDAPTAEPMAAPIAPKPNNQRMDWIDSLRLMMILFVVNIHACVTYSFVGSWYYNAPPEPSMATKIPFAIWEMHLQSFFMGLLFLVGGYFADQSLARRGTGSFIKERFRRLGFPALIYMLVLDRLIVFGMHPGYEGSSNLVQDYTRFVLSGRFLGASGPMWFAVTLLIFSTAYAFVARRLPSVKPTSFALRPTVILGIAVTTGIVSFGVRIWQPIGTSIMNMQLCFFAQYCVAFVIGIWLSKTDSLKSLSVSPAAKRMGVAALIFGPISLILILATAISKISPTSNPLFGGLNPYAFCLAIWEQVVGFSLALGVIYWCASKFDRVAPRMKWLSDRSFGVYWLHPPILVALALAMQPFRTNPYVMAIVLTVAGLGVSFVIADLAKRIPVLNRVL